MAKKKRPTTDNRGAADERACIRNHVRRMPGVIVKGRVMIDATSLLVWINDRAKRFRTRRGGL